MCASVSQYFALCVCVHVLHNDKKQKNAIEFSYSFSTSFETTT